MELLKNFGFEPIMFLAQIVNFLILVYIFRRFLYLPILKVLASREEKIKQGLKDAEQAHLELIEAEEDKDQIIRKAGKEAEKILEDTQKAAEGLRDTILAEAQKNAEKFMHDARTQMKAQGEELETQIKSQTIDAASRILNTVLEQTFTQEEKDKIMRRSIQRLSEVTRKE